MLADAPGPRHSQPGSLSETIALMRQQRRVRRHDDDDRARTWLAPVGFGEMGLGYYVQADARADGHAVDRQAMPAPVIGLYQRSNGVTPVVVVQHPRGRSDPALEVVADHAGAAADV